MKISLHSKYVGFKKILIFLKKDARIYFVSKRIRVLGVGVEEGGESKVFKR